MACLASYEIICIVYWSPTTSYDEYEQSTDCILIAQQSTLFSLKIIHAHLLVFIIGRYYFELLFGHEFSTTVLISSDVLNKLKIHLTQWFSVSTPVFVKKVY